MQITEEMITVGIQKWFNRHVADNEINSPQYRKDMHSALEAVFKIATDIAMKEFLVAEEKRFYNNELIRLSPKQIYEPYNPKKHGDWKG